MKSRRGLARKLWRAFLLQAVLIGVASTIGVFAARYVLQDILIEQALRGEADYYWSKKALDPEFPLPDTRNMHAYRQGEGGTVSSTLRGLEPGFHKLQDPDQSLVYVSEKYGDRLYLVFDDSRVDELATIFGLVPLAVVLAVIYLALYWAYRISRRAVSPVIALARQVERLDPEAPDPAVFDPDRMPPDTEDEIRTLAAAMNGFAARQREFVERERIFTRDASHELRSPLTVIRIAADMLEGEQELPAHARTSVRRIRQAATDMEELTAAFLLLARQSERALPEESVCVNTLAEEEAERLRIVAGDKPVQVRVDATCRLLVTAPEKVLASVIGNLMRNAFAYTERGEVVVSIVPASITIADSGTGMSAQEIEQIFKPFYRAQDGCGGHGVGLTIVKRLCDRFGWAIEIESAPGEGTRASVHFPESGHTPLATAEDRSTRPSRHRHAS